MRYAYLGPEGTFTEAAATALASERAGLMARNEQARSRVEAMIQRLKALENNG